MFPGMNPRQVKGMMKKLGIKQQEIDAEEVIIRMADKEWIIKNPQISKINMMGQETFQITGEIEEKLKKELSSEKELSEEDIKIVMKQAGCSREDAVKSLEENGGDIAKAIVSIKGQG